MTIKNKSALHEKEGVSQPETTSKSSAQKIIKSRSKHPTTDTFVTEILKGKI